MAVVLASNAVAEIDAASHHQVAQTAVAARGSSGLVGGPSKRAFDVCFALTALIVLSPLFILVALAVRSFDGGAIFYRHRRVGANGAAFDCIKFRTMRQDGDRCLREHLLADAEAAREWAETRKLKNDPRVTPIGSALRKTSLDELPQLINILAGSMSVVGPRPVVSEEVALYGPDASRYFATRPGLTGAWQVSGRNDVSYDERVRLDRAYVDGWSFARDLSIILRTVPAVFMSRGSY